MNLLVFIFLVDGNDFGACKVSFILTRLHQAVASLQYSTLIPQFYLLRLD